MIRFILWRIFQLPVVMAAIYLVTFFLVWIAPGDPFAKEKNVDPLVIKQMQRDYHADSAMHFLMYYPALMLTGDFGPSFSYQGWHVGQVIKSWSQNLNYSGAVWSDHCGFWRLCIGHACRSAARRIH